MSVAYVPSRKTTSEESYVSHKATDSSLILVVNESEVENFSIELTIGQNWSDRYDRTGEMLEIGDEGVQLPPHGSVVIEVAEIIGVPFNLYGLVIPTGSLFLDRGIIIAAAKIEPAFKGRLKLRLVNTTAERQTLTRKQKVASAVFFSTDVTKFAPETGKKAIRATRAPSLRSRLRKWASANKTAINLVVSICCSSVASLFLGYLAFGARSASPATGQAKSDVAAGQNTAAQAGNRN